MWNKFSKSMKKKLKKGNNLSKHGDYKYPITYQLIKDGKINRVLHKKIYHNLKLQ